MAILVLTSCRNFPLGEGEEPKYFNKVSIKVQWYPITSCTLVFFISRHYGTPSCQSPSYFLYRYQNCHHSCAQSVHTYKFQFLLDLCTRLKMLPGLIFLCQGCRRCLDNLPLKILSCLRSFPHQIKMAFTFYSCLISTAMMMRNAILRNNPVEGDMQKIGARWQR